MASGTGVKRLVKKTMDLYARGGHFRLQGFKKDGPVVYAKTGPWRVEYEGPPEHPAAALYHYGTKMLTWKFVGTDIHITGWWTGHGSVSDQQGVNAALSELGSTKRYYRDQKGGGPRVNPYAIGSSVGLARSVSPPVYNPRFASASPPRYNYVFPPKYNSRRRRRRTRKGS